MSATDPNRGAWARQSTARDKAAEIATERRQRLAWLYGDVDARIAANAPDVRAWDRLDPQL